MLYNKIERQVDIEVESTATTIMEEAVFENGSVPNGNINQYVSVYSIIKHGKGDKSHCLNLMKHLINSGRLTACISYERALFTIGNLEIDKTNEVIEYTSNKQDLDYYDSLCYALIKDYYDLML
jgi:hypothetical protein